MLTLNVYKNQREVEKTLTCEQYDLMLGTLEDVIKLFKIGDIDNELANMNQSTMMKIIVQEYDKITILLHDVFPDLTAEDRRKIKAKDLINFFWELITYAISQVMNIQTRKN